MELRRVDPSTLIPDPNNPRRTPPNPVFDEQLAANLRETNGPLQPPVVRQLDDGRLMIRYGHRRVRCSIMAEIGEIWAMVSDAEPSSDSMAAFSENMMRTGMCSVDIWRAIEAFVGQGYTEPGISTALSIPVRTIRKLRLFANLHPAMLDRMAQGDEPNEAQLRVIASATRDEQAAVWKKHRPKKTEKATWWQIEQALQKRRINASVAKFDNDFAASFGLHWTEDLFVEGGTDPRFTDQVDLFMATQQAWLEQNLPTNAQLLDTDGYGDGKLPPKAQVVYGSDRKRKGVTLGVWVCAHSGEIREKPFQFPASVKASDLGGNTGSSQKAARPDVSSKGQELIGDYRTEALHQALEAGEIRDDQLIGLLVLALAGKNVRVEQDPGHWGLGGRREVFARAISEGGMITADPETLRTAARGILKEVISCKVGMSGSGILARVAGSSIQANAYLPNMAHDDFLTKLSKDGVTKAVRSLSILPRNTGKEMRAALKEHVGNSIYIHPDALFDLTPTEQVDLAKRRATDLGGEAEDPDKLAGNDAAEDELYDAHGDDGVLDREAA